MIPISKLKTFMTLTMVVIVLGARTVKPTVMLRARTVKPTVILRATVATKVRKKTRLMMFNSLRPPSMYLKLHLPLLSLPKRR